MPYFYPVRSFVSRIYGIYSVMPYVFALNRYRFNPGAAFDVKVENPTFGYSAFQEEEPYHENEGFLSEPKVSCIASTVHWPDAASC